jgi:hypothetical protein
VRVRRSRDDVVVRYLNGVVFVDVDEIIRVIRLDINIEFVRKVGRWQLGRTPPLPSRRLRL